jgi:S-DNA-T family DNA segregation ATPase FtsK/SpoIIIE
VELRLVVESRGQPSREVAIDAQPDHTVAELIAALAGHLELPDPPALLRLQCRRSGAWLAPTQPLAGTGLRWGDRIVLGRTAPQAPPDRTAVVDLLVLSGPSAGLRQPLPPGEHRVGSFRYSGIVVDDPAVARIHLLVQVTPVGTVTIWDPESESGTFVEGRRISDATEVRPGQVVRIGGSLLTFARPDQRPPAQGPAPDGSGRIAFNRPPRMAQTAPTSTFALEAIPTRQGGSGLPLSYAVVPLIFAGVLFYFYKSWYLVLFALLSPVMMVFSLLETRFPNRISYRRSVRRFHRRLQELDRQMAEAAAAETAYARASAPDVLTLLDRARGPDPALWERRPDDEDWLLLRIGWADRPTDIQIQLPDGGVPRLREEAATLPRRHQLLHATPLTVSLREHGVLGLAGEERAVGALARWLGLQLAILHSPEDLLLAAAVPAAARAEWTWLGWLPHVRAETSPLPEPTVVGDRIAARGLLDRLLALVAQRQEALRSPNAGRESRVGPTVVVFLHEEVELPRGAVVTLLEQGPAVGVHAIWLGTSASRLPGQCGAVVELRPGSPKPLLTLPATGASVTGGGVDGISGELALETARALAAVRDVGARGRQAGIPRRVAMMEMLDLRDDPEGRIMQQWVRDRSTPEDRTLSAAWGMAAGGELFSVSLRLDGPHALVGGMTGAGKSELLQSFVAALAVTHSPRTLTFLLVDYKGGAAFKDCVDLPHTVGFVTDLDGHLVNRALVSLRAELRRREEVLRLAGAKDLLDLERRDPERAPASLVIVVDEFAALASELPQFVDGMVDVAQRGRSLGIHLLLATQRPAGVINDKIRANTNLRVALRFSDVGESQDVIGVKDAARAGLPPGRAFARIGPAEVTEFQAAYVGGHTAAGGGPAPLTVQDLAFGGVPAAAPRPASRQRAAPEPATAETDLQRLVRAVGAVTRRLRIPAPPRPWQPTLPETLPLDSLLPGWRPAPGGGPRGLLGVVDEPAAQRQTLLDLGLEEEGSLLVYGTSGSGKTTLLRTLACSLAMNRPPSTLHLYALDFATRGLRPLEALPHCGGVISDDDPERAVRLLGMLQTEMERRKALFAAAGAGSLGEYLAARPAQPLPHVLVLLDGFPNFAATFENVVLGAPIQTLRALVSEGRPLGLAFAISADRSAPYFGPLSSSISRRLILRQATDDEYAVWGLPRAVYADAHLPPGRGFTERALEVQCAVLGPDPSGSAQAAAVARLGAELHGRGEAAAVPEVRTLPSSFGRAALPRPAAALEAVVGLDDDHLRPVRVDLSEGHFLVTGPRRSGRTTALATFALSLATAAGAPRLHLLCPRRQSPLAHLGVWASTALGAEACAEVAGQLAQAARQGSDGGALRGGLLVIDDGEELLQGDAASDLEWIAQHGVEQGLHILAAADSQAAQRAYSSWLPTVLKDRQGILLDPDSMDGNMLGVRLPPRSGAWPPGRGYLVRRGGWQLVQLAGD